MTNYEAIQAFRDTAYSRIERIKELTEKAVIDSTCEQEARVFSARWNGYRDAQAILMNIDIGSAEPQASTLVTQKEESIM